MVEFCENEFAYVGVEGRSAERASDDCTYCTCNPLYPAMPHLQSIAIARHANADQCCACTSRQVLSGAVVLYAPFDRASVLTVGLGLCSSGLRGILSEPCAKFYFIVVQLESC